MAHGDAPSKLPSSRSRIALAAIGVLLAVVAIWFVRRPHLPPGHVRVTASFQYDNGEPGAGLVGVVRFDPEDTYKSGVRGACTGNLFANGRFELMTRDSGDGVAVGDYRVVLMALKPDGSPPEQIHDDYTHFETTPWRAHVTSTG